jgi:hypothetical protein
MIPPSAEKINRFGAGIRHFCMFGGPILQNSSFFRQSGGASAAGRAAGKAKMQKKLRIFKSTAFWSGRRGSNSLPPPWQGGALPDELRPRIRFSER